MQHQLNLKLILEGCQSGNRRSQQRLYEHFYGYALSICLRYSKNREEAVEVMNDGFLKVFNNLHRYHSDYPFRIWLRRILINSAIDYYRKYHKQPAFLELDTQVHDLVTTSDFQLDSTTDVLPVLQKLSPAYRMVFNLYVMEGYKHHEIAEQLGISVSTSKTNLARAKEKLKTLLQQPNSTITKKNRHG